MEDCFPNPFPPVPPPDWAPSPGPLLHIALSCATVVLREAFEGGVCAVQEGDVYLGSAGVADAFLRLTQCTALSQRHRSMFLDAVGKLLAHSRSETSLASRDASSLLCDAAGVCVATASAAAVCRDSSQVAKCVSEFASLSVTAKRSASYEMLYGKAGYAIGLGLCVCAGGVVPPTLPLRLWAEIVSDGRAYARKYGPSGCPLMYAWPPDEPAQYLGAAHGLCGILYGLMCVPAAVAEHKVILTRALAWMLDRCESREYPGRYYTAAEETGEGKGPQAPAPPSSFPVHWCHGSTGMVFLWTQAHAVLCEPAVPAAECTCAWMAAARRAADVVWRYGLLRKGPGLCHGVSGNGYALLRMYTVTREMGYLYQAHAFALALESEDVLTGCRRPDNPYSLFEGLAGSVAFAADCVRVCEGVSAGSGTPPVGFPFFELPLKL